MAGGFGVGCYGHGGGIALLWSQEVVVQLESYDKMHIDVTIQSSSSQTGEWRFTGFYGEARRELRYRSWDLLKLLSTKSSLPWLCAGDFNEVLHAEEQFGGQGRTERQMEGFREEVDVCGFVDLGFIGLPYTWDNQQRDSANIKCRLDRGFANGDFLDLFQSVKVWHVQTAESDHCALVLECLKRQHRRARRRRGFCYENMWRRGPSYRQLVTATWNSLDRPSSLGALRANLDNISCSLSDWEHSTFGSVRKEMVRLRRELEQERRPSLRSGPTRKEAQLMSRMSELLSREEIMFKQRSRVDWLKEGDRNTAFFQAKLRERA
jgi:hypothetical protein